MRLPVVAIFDIGKTNKKLFLFDEDYNVVLEKSEELPETKDEDGYPCEDIHELVKWIKNGLDYVSGLTDFNLKAINFSAHGASYVHLDEHDQIITPLYNYLNPFPSELKQRFDEDYKLNEVCVSTASPYLGNLNSGLQLYKLKHQNAKIFERIKYSLHLPEFLSYLITKQKVSCLPSIGCHTMLWDFKHRDYHAWVTKEGIASKLAPVIPSGHTFEILSGKESIHVGAGIHDSSAALIPYLEKIKSSFVLISTGTWSISLNPFNQSELTNDELGKDSLCYLGFDGRAVKASRLLIGPWHDEQVKRIAEHFHLAPDFYKSVQFEGKSLRAYTHDSVILDLNRFNSAQQAYHALMHHLVINQRESTQLVLGHSNVKEIYVDGGFGGNPLFMNLLSLEFSDYKVFGSSVAQASALGAAYAIHSKWNGRAKANSIKIIPYQSIK